MSTTLPNEMKVVIFNKEYLVSCPEGQEEKLIESANFLKRRMQETRDSNSSIGTDQTIAITALNLAHDLLEQRQKQQRREQENEQSQLRQQNESNRVRERLQAIKKRLDTNAFQRRMRSGQLHQF